MSNLLFRPISHVIVLGFLFFGFSLILSVTDVGALIGCQAEPVQAQGALVVDTGNTVPTFILLASSSQPQLLQLQGYIQANGGGVTHIFPYQALIARLSTDLGNELAAWPGVAMVLTQPAELANLDPYGPSARQLVRSWNDLIAPPPAVSPELSSAEIGPELEDALLAPDLPQAELLALESVPSLSPGYYQTSEFMAGSVAVGLVLVKSDGRVDPSTEDWTPDERQQVFSEIVAALNWWAELEPRANLTFVYDDHFSSPLPTRVEPITRPYRDQAYWISDAMSALGYDGSLNYFGLVRDYNNDLRDKYGTDWAFTIFVVDSSADADNRFSDYYFAYAYLGGPFMVLTYGNNGYGPSNIDAVAAHEIGHIFFALDQYYQAYQPCDRRSGYLYVENQNSQYGACASNRASIMRGSIFPYMMDAIDEYAAGQIGWRDSDRDNILDPLDTPLPISIDTLIQVENSVTVTGLAQLMPYPTAHPYRSSVTINTLIGVRYRLDGGAWFQATAADGAFDSATEPYTFTVEPLSPGLHLLEVAAIDSAGNISAPGAAQTITVFAPVNSGPETLLFAPGGELSGQAVALEGVSYHLAGQVISKVEYRINGGPWQLALAQDGRFDSDYEPFTIPLDFSTPGTYLIEALATDAAGNEGSDPARQEIVLTNGQPNSIFLPLVIR